MRPRSCLRSRPHPQSIQYCSSYEYPLARSRSSAISLVIESERERTGADADAHVYENQRVPLTTVMQHGREPKCNLSLSSKLIRQSADITVYKFDSQQIHSELINI